MEKKLVKNTEMIKCEYCGRFVDSDKTECPSCGAIVPHITHRDEELARLEEKIRQLEFLAAISVVVRHPTDIFGYTPAPYDWQSCVHNKYMPLDYTCLDIKNKNVYNM